MIALRLVLGWVMIALGLFVALHPLWSHGRPVTASIWLDMAFAAVFLLRGVMNIRAKRRTAPSAER
jgi:uncharacterized membrane protein HdeD (DUF308 family)